jgi:hypothetical protein
LKVPVYRDFFLFKNLEPKMRQKAFPGSELLTPEPPASEPEFSRTPYTSKIPSTPGPFHHPLARERYSNHDTLIDFKDTRLKLEKKLRTGERKRKGGG